MLTIAVCELGGRGDAYGDPDMNLVRMAALIGDHVTVASGGFWFMKAVTGDGLTLHPLVAALARTMIVERQVQQGEVVPDSVLVEADRFMELLTAHADKISSHDPVPHIDFSLSVDADELFQLQESLNSGYDGTWSFSNALNEIETAVDVGLVEVAEPSFDVYDPLRVNSEMAEHIANAFEGSSWPFVDEGIDWALRYVADEAADGDIEETNSLSKRRSSAAGMVSTRLLGDLVNFPELHLDQVLELREDFHDDLLRLRSEISSLASTPAAEVWSSEMADEIDWLFAEKVTPALLDLRRAIARTIPQTQPKSRKPDTWSTQISRP